MGGENIKTNLKNQMLFQYLRDKKKKKRRRGLRQRRGENSPVSPPLDPHLMGVLHNALEHDRNSINPLTPKSAMWHKMLFHV